MDAVEMKQASGDYIWAAPAMKAKSEVWKGFDSA